jgi:hypothetical protein
MVVLQCLFETWVATVAGAREYTLCSARGTMWVLAGTGRFLPPFEGAKKRETRGHDSIASLSTPWHVGTYD